MDQPRPSSLSQPTASAMVARYVVELFEARGVPCGPVLERIGLARELLQRPDARIALSAYDALWREAVSASGDPLAAVEVGRQLPLAAYRIVGYSSATAATLREALAIFGQYFPLLKGGFALTVRRRGEAEYLEYCRTDGAAPWPPEVASAGTAALLGFAEEITRQPFRLREIRLPFEAPPHATRLAEALGAPLRFGAGCLEVWPVPGALDAPVAGPDPTLRTHFERLARQALEAHRRAREYAEAVAALEGAVERARATLQEQRRAAAADPD